jgi:hypothetical protein
MIFTRNRPRLQRGLPAIARILRVMIPSGLRPAQKSSSFATRTHNICVYNASNTFRFNTCLIFIPTFFFHPRFKLKKYKSQHQDACHGIVLVALQTQIQIVPKSSSFATRTHNICVYNASNTFRFNTCLIFIPTFFFSCPFQVEKI